MRVHFELKNAPTTFQQSLDIQLSKGKWQYALEYLVNIVVYSRLPEDHVIHSQEVLTLLYSARATLKFKNYEVFTN